MHIYRYVYIYIYILYIYITYMCILYLYIYKFKFTSKCHSQTLPHRRNGDNKGQETFLATSAEYIT